MANSNSLTTIARQVGVELDIMFLVENGAIGSIAAGSVTSEKYFRNSRWGTDHFASQQYTITRMGAASSADYERPAGDLTSSTGALAHTGANYSDTTLGSEAIEMWKAGIRRTTDVANAIDRALANLRYTTFVPVSDASAGSGDGDMAASGTSAYTSVLTPTLSKVTTAARVPYGIQALRVLNDAANEGVQLPTFSVRQLRTVRYGAITSQDVGSVTFNAYDVTSSANFSQIEAITVSEEEPQLVWSEWGAVPDSCKEASVRAIGTTSTTDAYYNFFWFYRLGTRRLNLPSYVTEAFEMPSIFQARPLYSGGTSNVWDALALDFVPLKEGVDFRYIINQRDANPTGILLLHDGCLDYPLMTEARLAYPAISGTEANTTACPLKEIVPAAKIELLDAVGHVGWPGGLQEWSRCRQKAVEQFTQATRSRTFKPVAGAQPYYSPPRIG